MATCSSCIKHLESTSQTVFTVSDGWNSATCTWKTEACSTKEAF